MLIFALVVGPAIVLSFLAARVLESWQIVLQKRMAVEAGHVLDEAVIAWDRELGELHSKSDLLVFSPKSLHPWVSFAGELSFQYNWVKGVFIFQTGNGLLYPAMESTEPIFDSTEPDKESSNLLSIGGAYLGKGETNSAIQCFERVGGVRLQDSGEGLDFKQRDPEEGFYYDLVAIKKLAEIYAFQGQSARALKLQEKALERVLSRFDELAPLQRELMVEWMAGAEGIAPGLQSQWRERIRGRAFGKEERSALVNAMGMTEPAIPDSGWITLRMKQSYYLVTRIQSGGSMPLVLMLQFDERRLMEHLNTLFAGFARHTEIRIRCQTGGGQKAGSVLASRQLSPPFEAISLIATPEDVPAFVANARLQTRLYQGGGILLLISVVAGIWLVWREAAGEIRQARERSDFAATVSHDLRTPLSSMRMLAESLYMGNVTDEVKQKKFLGAIIKESDRLSRLTDRALYYIRYGQGALRYQFTEGDLGRVIREAVETFAVGAQVEVKFDLSPDLPHVKFDAGAMEQVVYNLLDNAVKYSRKDESGLIEVRMFAGEGKVVLSIQDHGAGMAPDEIRRVLKPYVRGKNAGRQNAGGIGLGLALCQHIVQAHGGRIQIESELGSGSKFSVILPG